MSTTEKPTENITQRQLEKVLMAISGATPATIVAVTDVKMNKTNNPYHGLVQKIEKSNVFINFDYTAAVNRRRAKEGNEEKFEASPRTWGERIPNTPLIMHKGQFYLECRYLGKTGDITYWMNNEPIDKALIENYMPARKSAAEHQGLEEEIVIRSFKLEGIREIHVGGKIYIVN